MRAVLDSSVGLKTVLPEPDSSQAIILLSDYVIGQHDLIAPDTYPVEVAHSLTRAGRRGIITPADAELKFADLMVNAPHLQPYLPLLTRAVEISTQCRVGVYDCLFLALAEREGCEFITADTRLVNSLQPQFPFIVHLSTL